MLGTLRKRSRSESLVEVRERVPPPKRRAVVQRSSPSPQSPRADIPISPRLLRSTPPPESPPLSPHARPSTVSLLPLTGTNMQRLEQAQTEARASLKARERSPSPNRTNNNLKARDKLAAFGIEVDVGHRFPRALNNYLQDVILQPRAPEASTSPNAKKVVDKRATAARQNEGTGIERIEPHLLFRGDADQCDMVAVSSIPLISSKNKVYLQKCFLPEPPSSTVKNLWGAFSRPIPDTCIGYVTRGDIKTTLLACDAPFDEDEEQILQSFAVAQSLHFPFLTSQWKSPNSTENLMTAANQAARDGVVIVNHLHDFFRAAYPTRTPTAVETCHFSVTCDLNYLEIWVHWREGDVHHMEQVDNFSLRKQDRVLDARNILRNITTYATGERLAAIKAALPAFKASQQKGRVRSIPPPESTVPPSSSTSLDSMPPALQFMWPMTPGSMGGGRSATSEPAKKRSRTES